MIDPTCRGYFITLSESRPNPPATQHTFRVEPVDDDYHLLWPTASIMPVDGEIKIEFTWHEEPDRHKDRIEASIREAIEDQWHTFQDRFLGKDDDRLQAGCPTKMGNTSLEQLIDELLFERSHHDLFGEFSREELI
jgi:hypothetical protein